MGVVLSENNVSNFEILLKMFQFFLFYNVNKGYLYQHCQKRICSVLISPSLTTNINIYLCKFTWWRQKHLVFIVRRLLGKTGDSLAISLDGSAVRAPKSNTDSTSAINITSNSFTVVPCCVINADYIPWPNPNLSWWADSLSLPIG